MKLSATLINNILENQKVSVYLESECWTLSTLRENGRGEGNPYLLTLSSLTSLTVSATQDRAPFREPSVYIAFMFSLSLTLPFCMVLIYFLLLFLMDGILKFSPCKMEYDCGVCVPPPPPPPVASYPPSSIPCRLSGTTLEGVFGRALCRGETSKMGTFSPFHNHNCHLLECHYHRMQVAFGRTFSPLEGSKSFLNKYWSWPISYWNH